MSSKTNETFETAKTNDMLNNDICDFLSVAERCVLDEMEMVLNAVAGENHPFWEMANSFENLMNFSDDELQDLGFSKDKAIGFMKFFLKKIDQKTIDRLTELKSFLDENFPENDVEVSEKDTRKVCLKACSETLFFRQIARKN